VRTLRFAVALLAVVVLHALGVRLVPEFARSVDLFFVLTVLSALGGDSLVGLLAGLTAGLTHDVFTAGLFALHGFADTAVGYAVARLAQRLLVERARGVLLVAAVASVVQQAILAALALTLLADPELPQPLWIAVQAASTGVLAATAFTVGRRLRSGMAARRSSRSRRLHLD